MNLKKRERGKTPFSEIKFIIFVSTKSIKNEPLNFLAKIYNCDYEK
jgi:hypothetical protein